MRAAAAKSLAALRRGRKRQKAKKIAWMAERVSNQILRSAWNRDRAALQAEFPGDLGGGDLGGADVGDESDDDDSEGDGRNPN